MSKKIFFEELEKARDEQRLMAAHTNRYSDTFFVGYVHALSEQQVCVRAVSKHGRPDGFSVRRIEDIFRIEVTSRYMDNLEVLARAQHSQTQTDFLPAHNSYDNLFQLALERAQDLGWLVYCEFDNETDSIYGEVLEVGVETVRLRAIDENGLEESETLCLLDDIFKMNCNDEELRDLEILRNGHNVPPF